jgi:hypothetical protein
MTTRTVLRAVLARWPLTLVGLALTAVGIHHVSSAPSPYYGQVAVHFLAPPSDRDPNQIQTETLSLIQTAGIIKAIVNDGSYAPGESLALTLRTTGEASSISMPDSGSQWIQIFSKPVLMVEATGHDPETVMSRIDESRARIRATLEEFQDQDQVDAHNRITVADAPEEPVISHEVGAPRRAMAGTALLGLALTVWLVCEADRWLRRRRGVRAARPSARRRRDHVEVPA